MRAGIPMSQQKGTPERYVTRIAKRPMQRVKRKKRDQRHSAVPEFLCKITIALFLLSMICTAIPQASDAVRARRPADRYPAAIAGETPQVRADFFTLGNPPIHAILRLL
jgi:hypothetical protein